MTETCAILPGAKGYIVGFFLYARALLLLQIVAAAYKGVPANFFGGFAGEKLARVRNDVQLTKTR